MLCFFFSCPLYVYLFSYFLGSCMGCQDKLEWSMIPTGTNELCFSSLTSPYKSPLSSSENLCNFLTCLQKTNTALSKWEFCLQTVWLSPFAFTVHKGAPLHPNRNFASHMLNYSSPSVKNSALLALASIPNKLAGSRVFGIWSRAVLLFFPPSAALQACTSCTVTHINTHVHAPILLLSEMLVQADLPFVTDFKGCCQITEMQHLQKYEWTVTTEWENKLMCS